MTEHCREVSTSLIQKIIQALVGRSQEEVAETTELSLKGSREGPGLPASESSHDSSSPVDGTQ